MVAFKTISLPTLFLNSIFERQFTNMNLNPLFSNKTEVSSSENMDKTEISPLAFQTAHSDKGDKEILRKWWSSLDLELVIDRLDALDPSSAEEVQQMLIETDVDPEIWEDVTGSPYPRVLEGIPSWDLVEMAAVLEQYLDDYPDQS